MKFIIKTLILTLAVLISAWLLPGVHIAEGSFLTGVWVALLIALFNAFLRPILVLLTLPATVLTFGLFLLVINAIIILLVDHFIDGFSVNGFWWALLFSLVLSIVHSFFGKADKKGQRQSR